MDEYGNQETVATGWLPRLSRLADDVDVGLPPRATSDAIRAIVADVVRAQHRDAELANLCGGTR